MKRFQFRYQTLLEVRERKKKIEEERFTRFLGEQRLAESELAELVAHETAQRNEMGSIQQGDSLDLQMIGIFQGFLIDLERRIKQQESRVKEAHVRMGQQKYLLDAALREWEMVVKLKERDEKAWRMEVERGENALMDELATLRHGRVDTPLARRQNGR
jgi:flagellar FliJ protein